MSISFRWLLCLRDFGGADQSQLHRECGQRCDQKQNDDEDDSGKDGGCDGLEDSFDVPVIVDDESDQEEGECVTGTCSPARSELPPDRTVRKRRDMPSSATCALRRLT